MANIAIVGYGVEGKALVMHFSGKGHAITVCDKVMAAGVKEKPKDVNFRFGAHYLSDLGEFDVIYRSPGVPYLNQKFDAVRGKLSSLTRYFFEKCPCSIIGVTGTKGKGTTATLIFEMLKPWKKGGKHGNVFLGGNIGRPPLEFLHELKKDDIVVLELSSFQLQDLDRSPHIAVVLGLSPDHMDYHKNMEEYLEAKKNVVAHQGAGDFAIFDSDNKESAEMASDCDKTGAAKFFFSTKKALEAGAFLRAGSFIFNTGKSGTIFGDKNSIKVSGEHNVRNILAAGTAAFLAGAPVEAVSKTVAEFTGLPHRLEFVAKINGARFFNDSASTNPQTAIAALRAFDTPIILIAGGSDKNTDFAPLAKEISMRPTSEECRIKQMRQGVRTVILMGETKKKLETSIESAVAREPGRIAYPLEMILAESYQEAFMVAKMLAREGDTVILSPACASFDMFANYQERGDIFRNFILDAIA